MTNFCQSVPKTPMKVGEQWATIGRAANHAGQHSNTAHSSSLRLKAKGRMARSGEQRTGRQGAIISGRFACNLGNPYAEKEARLRPQPLFFHVPVLDEVFAESGLGNPDEQVSVEKHKKAQSPRRAISSHQKARILVAWKNLIYSRSRMGLQWSRCSCEGGSRYPASTIRLILGAGRPACKCEALYVRGKV